MNNSIDARGKALSHTGNYGKERSGQRQQGFYHAGGQQGCSRKPDAFRKSGGFDIAVIERGEDEFSVRFIKSEKAGSDSAGKERRRKKKGSEKSVG